MPEALPMAVSSSEPDLTADRSETKYLLPRERAERVGAELSRHHHVARVAGISVETAQSITTVYFDTRSRRLYREGMTSASRLRIRAREYDDGGRASLWLELKRRQGSHSTKRRIGLSPSVVPWFLAHGRITEERIRLHHARGQETEAIVLEELLAICVSYREPFEARAVVTFERLAWQEPAGGLRVTLDRELTFYPPPADLWTRTGSPVREKLGPARRIERRAILEVKTRDTEPTWLGEILARSGAALGEFSKFEEASRAVHG
jgi:hypothetical protein